MELIKPCTNGGFTKTVNLSQHKESGENQFTSVGQVIKASMSLAFKVFGCKGNKEDLSSDMSGKNAFMFKIDVCSVEESKRVLLHCSW